MADTAFPEAGSLVIAQVPLSLGVNSCWVLCSSRLGFPEAGCCLFDIQRWHHPAGTWGLWRDLSHAASLGLEHQQGHGIPGEEMCISMDTPVCASDRADWGFLHCFNRLGRFHGKIRIIARYLESG